MWLAAPTPTPSPTEPPTAFEALTGGWPGLLQGGIGSVVGTLIGTLIGVIGAFWVARWTTHRELNRDRDNMRNQARIGAADRFNPILHDMINHLEHRDDDRIYVDQGWASGRVGSWLKLGERLKRQTAEDGALMPEGVRQQLTDVEKRLDEAYYINEHNHPQAPPYFEPGKTTNVTALQSSIEAAITALNTMRTNIFSPPSKQPWYRRVGVVWTIAGVAVIVILVLAAVLLLG